MDLLQKNETLVGRCECTKSGWEAQGTSESAGICHCKICQNVTNDPSYPWVLFQPERAEFFGSIVEKLPKGSQLPRVFCEECGSVLGRYPSPSSPLYRLHLGACSTVPEQHQPSMHIHYESRIRDVDDDLVKYDGTQTLESSDVSSSIQETISPSTTDDEKNNAPLEDSAHPSDEDEIESSASEADIDFEIPKTFCVSSGTTKGTTIRECRVEHFFVDIEEMDAMRQTFERINVVGIVFYDGTLKLCRGRIVFRQVTGNYDELLDELYRINERDTTIGRTGFSCRNGDVEDGAEYEFNSLVQEKDGCYFGDGRQRINPEEAEEIRKALDAWLEGAEHYTPPPTYSLKLFDSPEGARNYNTAQQART